MPHHATSNHIMIHVATIIRTLKTNVTSVRRPKTLRLAREHAHRPNYSWDLSAPQGFVK